MNALWNLQRYSKFNWASRARKQRHRHMFPLTPLVSTGRGRCTNQSWTICCKKWHQKEQSSCTKSSKTASLENCTNYKTKWVTGKQDEKSWMSPRDQTHSTTRFRISIRTYTPTCTLQSSYWWWWRSVSTAMHSALSGHLKNYLRSTMTTERVWGMALMQVHKETELDAERIIQQFSLQNHRRLTLLFRPEWRWG